jgi:hypothetical protein
MPDNGKKVAGLYEQLLAAEPHATAERKRELLLEATRRARQSSLFFDLTLSLSLSKSISIFHAFLGENARLAREAGDKAGEAYWSGLVAEVDAMTYQAVHASFGYFQREAGYTRTGSHGKRVSGRETGQWHEADLVVAHWLQHTSRKPAQAGSASSGPHARTVTVSRSRASRGRRSACSPHAGSRSAPTCARAKRFEQRFGRAPSQREFAQLAQASNSATRKSKEGAPAPLRRDPAQAAGLLVAPAGRRQSTRRTARTTRVL